MINSNSFKISKAELPNETHRQKANSAPPVAFGLKFFPITAFVAIVFATVHAVTAQTSLIHENEQILATFNDRDLLRMQYGVGSEKKSQYKPYFDVLATPEGRNILCDGPADHPHHHGLMFALMVDGVNFWEEHGNAVGKEKFLKSDLQLFSESKKIEQRKISTATLEFSLDWIDDKNVVFLHEKRKVVLMPDLVPGVTLLDWVSSLSPPETKKTIRLEALHYHGLGMRFDPDMNSGGRFFSSGDENSKSDLPVRGTEKLTPCRWMAYTANLQGKPVTVAIFASEKNARKMFAFTMGGDGKGFAYLSATTDLHREPLTLTEGKPFVLHYGIGVWDGEQTKEDIEKVYRIWYNKTL